MTAKRCFVISPIGAEGSEIREHADDVFDFIIKPAMDELGIYAYRSDHSQQLGRITDQMFQSILEEDFCIAVLSYFNPNVFYELAVAQCAARPVIILIEKGQSIPFDVRDLRCVEYDLRPRALRDRVYITQIVEIVKNLELVDWQVEVPFGKNLAPLGSKQRQLTLFDRVENFGTSENWLELLRNTSKGFDLSGVSLRWWTNKPAIKSLLLQKAREGCKIRLLLMHPENPALPQLHNETRAVCGVEHLAAEIRGTFASFTELAGLHPNVEVRQVRQGCLTHQITRIDDKMLITIMLYSSGTAQSPMLECVAESPLYRTMSEEFDWLWNCNALASAASLAAEPQWSERGLSSNADAATEASIGGVSTP